MGELITYPSNGSSAEGWLDTPFEESTAGLVVIQEWWGLNAHIKEIGVQVRQPGVRRARARSLPRRAHRRARRGRQDDDGARHRPRREGPHRRGRRAQRVDGCHEGRRHRVLHGRRPGALAGDAARRRCAAVAPFYGVIPWEAAQPDFTKMKAAVQGHYAELDDFAGPAAVAALEKTLKAAGLGEVEMFIYPGTRARVLQRHPARGVRRRGLGCWHGSACSSSSPPSWARRTRARSLWGMSARSRDLPRRSCLSVPGSSETLPREGPSVSAPT